MQNTFAESATFVQVVMAFDMLISFCAESVWQNRTHKY